MKKAIIALLGLSLLVTLTACSFLFVNTPTPLPTLFIIPSPTPLLIIPTSAAPTLAVPTPTVILPTVMPGAPMPSPSSAPTPKTGVSIPDVISGPYAVVLVAPGEVLNIRTGPGPGYAISGSFTTSAMNVMRTGPSSATNGDLWVQVQNPGGGSGWVNSKYLTESVDSATFCTDGRVNTLLTNFGDALNTSNGETLAALVSPAHGMAVHLWRYGIPIIFDREHARWVFVSTYEQNWGAAPASGMDTIGAFHVVALPWFQEVFNASYSLTCNSLGTATQYGSTPWPAEYTNVNYYTIYKPGTPGIDLDFRYLLVGVEFVQGQPYVFAVIHFAWEP